MPTSTKLELVSFEDPCARIILEVNIIWHCPAGDIVVYEVYGVYNLIGSCLFITKMCSSLTMFYKGRGTLLFDYAFFLYMLHIGLLIIILLVPRTFILTK